MTAWIRITITCRQLNERPAIGHQISHKSKAVKDNRPVNLDLTTIRLPVTALTSILHRVSGVAVFVGLALIIYLFDQASASEDSFIAIKECIEGSFLTRIALWTVVSALLFHIVMGVKHLIADLGFGETLESGKRASTIALAVAVVVILLAGVWIW